jgi:hypothetical protein
VLQDVYAATARIKAGGGKVTREAGPVKGGASVISFVESPCGAKWELIQRPQGSPELLCQARASAQQLARERRKMSANAPRPLHVTAETPRF